MDDLLHEQIVHAGAGQFGLLEGEPQVAQLGVARAGITSLHLVQQGEDDRLEAAAVGVAAAAVARSALAARVVIYICNTAVAVDVASGVAVAAVTVVVAVVAAVGRLAVSPQTADLLLAALGRSSMVR